MLKTEVEGPRQASFRWKATYCGNYLRYYIDGVEQSFLRYSSEEWQEVQIEVPAGRHEVKWEYYNSSNCGDYYGWVDLSGWSSYASAEVSRLFPGSYSSIQRVVLGNGVTNLCKDAFWGCENLKRVDVATLVDWQKIDFANETANPLFYGAELYAGGEKVSVSRIGFDSNGSMRHVDTLFAYGVSTLGELPAPERAGYEFEGWFTDAVDGMRVTADTIVENDMMLFAHWKLIVRGNGGPYVEEIGGREWIYWVVNEECIIGSGSYGRSAIDVKTVGDLVVPSSLGGHAVKSIGAYAFYDCRGLTSVTIPEGVTSIGSLAFEGCSGLTTVTIPEGVTSIEDGVFSGCSGLTLVTIPEGVTSIGSYAFDYCSELTSVTIPEGVTSIGFYAFFGCSGLTSVMIPEGVTSIEDGVFSGCSGLTSVTIPEGVTSIGSYAFFGCSGLTSVTIPEGVTSIGDYAFHGCSGLTTVTIPEGVANIGSYAFSGCSGLTAVRIPASVKSMGVSPFSSCYNFTDIAVPSEFSVKSIFPNSYDKLVSVTIPYGSKRIMKETFEGCVRIENLEIPMGLETIEQGALDGLPFYERYLDSCADGVVLLNGYILGVKGECPSVLELEANATLIAGGAFSNCTGLELVKLSSGIEFINANAFLGCENLKRVEVASFADWLRIKFGNAAANPLCCGAGLYVGGEMITDLVIPEGVCEIGEYAFAGYGVGDVTFPSSLSNVAATAFAGCTNVTSVEFDTWPNMLHQCEPEALGWSVCGNGVYRTDWQNQPSPTFQEKRENSSIA